MTKRTRRRYTTEFKEQLVQLHLHGKPRSEIVNEYDLKESAFDRWVKTAVIDFDFI